MLEYCIMDKENLSLQHELNLQQQQAHVMHQLHELDTQQQDEHSSEHHHENESVLIQLQEHNAQQVRTMQYQQEDDKNNKVMQEGKAEEVSYLQPEQVLQEFNIQQLDEPNPHQHYERPLLPPRQQEQEQILEQGQEQILEQGQEQILEQGQEQILEQGQEQILEQLQQEQILQQQQEQMLQQQQGHNVLDQEDDESLSDNDEHLQISDAEDDNDEPQQAEPIEVESVVLFVEDTINYALKFYNFNWNPPTHLYEERFYQDRERYFQRKVGKAIVHYCLSNSVNFLAGRLHFNFEEWIKKSDQDVRIDSRTVLERIILNIPYRHDQSLVLLSFASKLCVLAMQQNKPIFVNFVVEELVHILHSQYPRRKFYLDIKRSSRDYLSAHEIIHSLSDDDGLGNES